MLSLVLLVAAVVGIGYLIWDAPRSEREREVELAALGLIISGPEIEQRIHDGWRIYRVRFGREEYWATSGPPEVDSKRRILLNGKKLRLGRREPALSHYRGAIEDFHYRA